MIVLGGRHGSVLIDALIEHSVLSVTPLGEPGLETQPTIQVATKGLHFAHDTLCLVANDVNGLRTAVNSLLDHAKQPADQLAKPAATALVPANVKLTAKGELTSGEKVTPIASALTKLGTNEMVEGIQFDPAGNLYAITWGHGNNLYALDAKGKIRFSRLLPEMGTNRLEVFSDRLLAYTSAGARLYQLGLDNKPLSQARLNLDPGDILGCDNYSMSQADYAWVPSKRWLLHNMGDQMRVLDEQYNIVAHWEGETYFDKDVADRILHRQLHAYTLSPDGSRIAQFETSQYFTQKGHMDDAVYDVHLVIRDLSGKLLHEHKNIDNGEKIVAKLSWPADAVGPVIHAPNLLISEGHERWEFGPDAELLAKKPFDAGMLSLGGDRRLWCTMGVTCCTTISPKRLLAVSGPFAVMPTFAAVSADGQHLATLDETGLLLAFAVKDGKEIARVQVSQVGKVLCFTPDSQQIVIGGYRGKIMQYGLDGKLTWEQELGPANTMVGGYVAETELMRGEKRSNKASRTCRQPDASAL